MDYELDLIDKIGNIAKSLEKIAKEQNRQSEFQKIYLWYTMEDEKTTTRQKEILSEVLKKL